MPLIDYVKTIVNVLMLSLAGALVKRGMDQESAAQLTTAVGGIVVIGLVALSQRKKLLNTEPPAPTPPKDNGGGGGSLLPMLLMLILPATIITGCAGLSPEQRLANAERTVTALAETVKDVVDQDLVRDPKTLRAMQTALQESSEMLDAAHDVRRAGQTADLNFYLDQLERIVRRLQVLLKPKDGVSWVLPKSSRSYPPRSVLCSVSVNLPRKFLAGAC